MATQPGPKQGNPRKSGCGCSGLGVAFLCLICVAGVCWPIVLNSIGASANGVIQEKFEGIKIEYGDWFRHFQVTAAYALPGQPLQRSAICDVDEKTYDSLRIGSPVEVRYLRNFPPQPFLTTARLAPCSIVGISMGPSVWRLLVIGVGLLMILFIWWILRVRIILWVLLGWICFSAAYAVMPRLEPQPHVPVTTTATVKDVITIDALGETSESDGIPLQHPYQIVELKFVPHGMDAPVVAIDKIDQDSISGLKPGENVPIAYDAGNPRIARLQDGTRKFPAQAWIEVALCCAALAIVGALLLGAREILRMISRGVPF